MSVQKDNGSQFVRLVSDLAELRELYPHNCLCAARKQQALRELAALDLFAPEPNHEDYVPRGDQ